MENKVLLVLVDGMRPEAVQQCTHPFLREFFQRSTHTFHGRTVYPSITLPCHMSLFHSVTPERHGTMENVYVRPTHPLEGLFDLLARNEKRCGFFYTWAELRDLCKPGSLSVEAYRNYNIHGSAADCEMCDRTIRALKEEKPDFIFFYTGDADEVGHKYGWLGPEYMDAINLASANLQKIMEALPEEYSVVLTADHGGHGRTHGTEMPEDMTIPIALYGPQWEAGKELECIRLLDLAPTIAAMLGCKPSKDWDGISLL